MAAGKRDRRTGQGGTGAGAGHGRGEAPASATAADIHGIGMVLSLPPATVLGPPPDVNGATGREP
jgi:hypothetical protein